MAERQQLLERRLLSSADWKSRGETGSGTYNCPKVALGADVESRPFDPVAQPRAESQPWACGALAFGQALGQETLLGMSDLGPKVAEDRQPTHELSVQLSGSDQARPE